MALLVDWQTILDDPEYKGLPNTDKEEWGKRWVLEKNREGKTLYPDWSPQDSQDVINTAIQKGIIKVEPKAIERMAMLGDEVLDSIIDVPKDIAGGVAGITESIGGLVEAAFSKDIGRRIKQASQQTAVDLGVPERQEEARQFGQIPKSFDLDEVTGSMDRLKSDIGSIAPSLGATIAGGVVGGAIAGPVGSLSAIVAISSALNTSEAVSEMMSQGFSPEESIKRGLPAGLVNTVFDSFGATKLTKAFGRKISQTNVKDVIRDALAESGTEAIQEFNLLVAGLEGDNAEEVRQDFIRTFADGGWQRVREVVLPSLLLGGGTSLAGSAAAEQTEGILTKFKNTEPSLQGEFENAVQEPETGELLQDVQTQPRESAPQVSTEAGDQQVREGREGDQAERQEDLGFQRRRQTERAGRENLENLVTTNIPRGFFPEAPEQFHERQTVTRSFPDVQEQLRDPIRNLAPNTPVSRMVAIERERAAADPHQAMSEARQTVDPYLKSAKYIGAVQSGQLDRTSTADAIEEIASDWTVAGTVLRFAREMKMMTPEGRASIMTKVFRNWLKRMGLRVSEDHWKETKKRFEKAEAIEDADAHQKAIWDAVEFAVSDVPIYKHMWASYRYSDVLSNPRSLIQRNIGGNLISAFGIRPSVVSLKPGGGIKQSGLVIKESAKNVGKGWQEFHDAMTKKVESAKQFELFDNTMFDKAMQQRLPYVLQFVNRFLQGGDRFVGAMIEGGETARLIEKGVDPPTAKEKSKGIYEEYLFRLRVGNDMLNPSENPATRILDFMGWMMLQARNPQRVGKVPSYILTPILMFVTTPINIAKLGSRISPLGFLSPITKDNVSKGLFKKEYKRLNQDQQNQVDERWSDMIGMRRLGTLMTMIGSVFAAMGRTTWAPPEDEKEKEIFWAHRKPYSIDINGYDVPLWTFGPLALSLAIPAAFRDAVFDNPKAQARSMPMKMIMFMQQMTSYLLTQTPWSSFYWFNQALGGNEFAMNRFFSSLIGQGIPASGFMRYVNEFVDPFYRKPRTITESIESGIPSFSDDLPVYRDPDNNPSQKTLLDTLPPFPIGKRQEKYEEMYRDRHATLQLRHLNNKTLDGLVDSYRSGDIGASEFSRFLNNFDNNEKGRLRRRIKERHDQLELAEDLKPVRTSRSRRARRQRR